MYRFMIKTAKPFPDKSCNFHKFSPVSICRNYSSGPENKSTGKRLLFLLGFTALSGGGAILYIRGDPTAQKWIKDYIPGSQDFLQLINKEINLFNSFTVVNDTKKSLSDAYDNYFGSKKEAKIISSQKTAVTQSAQAANVSKSPKEQTETKPPVVQSSKNETESKQTIYKTNDNKNVKTVIEEPEKKQESVVELSNVTNEETKVKKKLIHKIDSGLKKLEELENQVKIYAVNIELDMKNYEEEIVKLIDDKTVQNDDELLKSISKKIRGKQYLISKAQETANKALKKVEKLKESLNDNASDMDSQNYENYKQAIRQKKKSIVNSMALVNFESSKSYLTDEYYKSVMKAREKLATSLGIAFPQLKIEDASALSDDELNLFIVYASKLIYFYQKELEKHETFKQKKLDEILEKLKEGKSYTEAIEVISGKKIRELNESFLQKETKLEQKYKTDLKENLRRIIEEFNDYLETVDELRNRETEHKIHLARDEKTEKLRINYNKQLSGLIGKLKGLEHAIIGRVEAEKFTNQSHLLWNSCQSLALALKRTASSEDEQLKPLHEEVKAISKVTDNGDELVNAVLNAIPKEAITRGIYSELTLKDRFLKVERTAYHLANVPEGHVSLLSLFWSYLQSLLIIKPLSIPTKELANEPFDPSTLSNYEILFRARYWVDRGEYLQAIRYMNLLKGAAYAISLDWINEMKIFLETQQVANTLLLYAIYSSQIYS